MHMTNELHLDRITFDTFGYNHQEVTFSPSVWHIEASQTLKD